MTEMGYSDEWEVDISATFIVKSKDYISARHAFMFLVMTA
jgi:hypothetical protein